MEPDIAIQSGLFNGQTALITAAGQGIGRAVARKLIDEGAQVHASDIIAEPMQDLGASSITRVDATDREAVKNWVSRFERIDCLVHAVGYVHQGTIEECSPQDWQQSIAITLDSAYHVFAAVVPKMKKHGGSVTAIASVASSIKGFPRRAAYGAAKGGVIGLVKACAADYLGDKIRFNAVCPGTVDSPSLRERMKDLAKTLGSDEAAEKFFLDRQPSGRLGTPEEIAGICAFLGSPGGSLITGQAINIDGGITI